MSSDADYVASLQLAVINLYKIGGPIFISLGIPGSIISLIVFIKKNLRKNPCAIYFVAVNTGNLLLIITSFLSVVLLNGYSIDPGATSVIVCRIRFYAIFLFDMLSPTYLIFASIDRVSLTSPNALTRQRSTPRLTYTCITFITLFWLICHSHVFVFTGIIEYFSGYFICYFQFGAYLTVISYYSLIIKGILVPIFMLIFGLWTVKNIRNIGRVAPTVESLASEPAPPVGIRSIRSKDGQLIRMLLADISVYVIFSLMVCIMLMYQQMTQYQSKDLAQTHLESFLISVATFSAYIPCCIGCYTNLLVSKTFRQEVRKFLMCK